LNYENLPQLVTFQQRAGASFEAEGGNDWISSGFHEPDDASPTPSIPEEVIAIAGPNQDLMSAFLRPEDSCYWYMHNGPVERTPLPLRTADNRPICIQAVFILLQW